MITYIDRFDPLPVPEPAPTAPSRERAAERWPILPPGTLVKAAVYQLRFRWAPVVEDPGPAHDRNRKVKIQSRTEIITVKRHNLTVRDTDKPISIFDSIYEPEPAPVSSPAPLVKPPPGE
jgi:hypothetical protein